MDKNCHMFRKGILVVGAIALAGVLVCGCGNGAAEPAPTVQTTAVQSEEQGQMLRLGVVLAPEETGLGFKKALMEENTSDSFNQVSIYLGIAQASWEVDGQEVPLEEALAQGKVTQEEIAYCAQMDARNGFCEETQETRNGLTHFTYRYPDFNLRVVNDVYVTPDGGQDRIRHTAIYPNRPDQRVGPYTNFYDPVTGDRTDWEDWGLKFEMEQVSPTQMKILCTQSEGQQIGQLAVKWYSLYNRQGFVQEKDPQASGQSPEYVVALNHNGQTVFTIDWEDAYGPLPAGTYWLTLNVIDEFDEKDVHPLMQDFHDWQAYDISFTIE